MNILNTTDFVVSFLYLVVIFSIAIIVRGSRIRTNDTYKYFIWGLLAKIGSAIAFCLIYFYYFKMAGDTFDYFHDSVEMCNFLYANPQSAFSILFGEYKLHNYTFLLSKGFNLYTYDFLNAFAVSKFSIIFTIITFKSFLASTIILSSLSYIIIWKFYLLLSEYYPKIKTELAIACLFVPSVLFWGSGILKDTYTHAATLGAFYCIFRIFISKRNAFYYSIIALFFIYVLISIKPYIFFPLAIAMIISFAFYIFNKIKSMVIKMVVLPFALIITIVSVNLFFDFAYDLAGQEFKNIDIIIGRIVDTQKAMKVAGSASYDIGEIEKTLPGIFQKFPQAVFTGLSRPFLWETQNILMLFSSIENLLILALSLFVFIFVGPINIFRLIWKNQLLMSLFIFSITFAFFVGLTSSNFGALVRFKIPLVPFYISGLLMLIFHRIRQIQSRNEVS